VNGVAAWVGTWFIPAEAATVNNRSGLRMLQRGDKPDTINKAFAITIGQFSHGCRFR